MKRQNPEEKELVRRLENVLIIFKYVFNYYLYQSYT